MALAVAIVFLIVFACILLYVKRHMLIKTFSFNISNMTDEFSAEIEQTSKQAVERIEQKMDSLEALLEEADLKIAALEEYISYIEQTYINKTTSRLVSEVPNHQSNNNAPAITTPAKTRLHEVSSEKREIVAVMHSQGHSVTDIAKAVSLGKGEVILLIELYKVK